MGSIYHCSAVDECARPEKSIFYLVEGDSSEEGQPLLDGYISA